MNKDQLENLEAEILNGLAEIESLEPRKTPAVTGAAQIVGGVLTLNFDNTNDTIEVTQNFDTITVHYEDSQGHTGSFHFTAGDDGLHKLVINSGGGSDSVFA